MRLQDAAAASKAMSSKVNPEDEWGEDSDSELADQIYLAQAQGAGRYFVPTLCRSCGEPGHLARECPSAEAEKVRCSSSCCCLCCCLCCCSC